MGISKPDEIKKKRKLTAYELGAIAFDGGIYSRSALRGGVGTRDAAKKAGIEDPLAIAIAVALAESGGRVRAIHHNTNGTVDLGPWQINRPTIDESLFDPYNNWGAAEKLFNERGWQPWVVFNRKSYKAYMPQANTASAKINHDYDSGSIVGQAKDAVTPDWTGSVTSAIGTLLNPHFWLRVIMVIGGGTLILLGLYMLAKSQMPGPLRRFQGGS